MRMKNKHVRWIITNFDVISTSISWIFASLISIGILNSFDMVIRSIFVVLLGIILLLVQCGLKGQKKILTICEYQYNSIDDIVLFSNDDVEIGVQDMVTVHYDGDGEDVVVGIGYFESQKGDTYNNRMAMTQIRMYDVFDVDTMNKILKNQRNIGNFYVTTGIRVDSITGAKYE